MFEKFELFWAKKRWARNNPRIQTCSITSLNEIGTRKRSPLYSSFKDQPKLYGWDDGRNGELFLKKKRNSELWAVVLYLCDQGFFDRFFCWSHDPYSVEKFTRELLQENKGRCICMYMSLWFGESDKTLTAVDIHILHLSYARPAHVSGSQHDQTCYPEQAQRQIATWQSFRTTKVASACEPWTGSSTFFFVFPHGWWNSVTLRLAMVKI